MFGPVFEFVFLVFVLGQGLFVFIWGGGLLLFFFSGCMQINKAEHA